MLIRFIVSNFLSFKEETEFNMLTGRNYKTHLDHVNKTESGVKLIKSAAVYGANGSGKSNLVKALEFIKSLIIEKTDEEDILMLNTKKFRLDKTYKEKPTTFRIEFEHDNVHFDYAIELFKGSISDEWLYKIDSIDKKKEELVFRRRQNNPINYGALIDDEEINFARGYEKKLLKDNMPFLSKAHEIFDNTDLFKNAFAWFQDFRIIDPYGEILSIPIISSEEDIRSFTSKVLHESKTGIESLSIKEIPFDVFFGYEDNELRQEIEESLMEFYEKHKDDIPNKGKYNIGKIFIKDDKPQYATIVNGEPVILVVKSIHFETLEFDLHEESDGTNRILELAPAFHDLINKNSVVVIDELERSMHPNLAKQLLNLFLKNSKTKSQLIFTTHESNLLDQNILRQDEIWFVEKTPTGSSHFYPLSDFKERYDKDIKKGYLQGRYGAIPFMANLSDLNWE
jgi:hypothetical protein